jgi:protein-tyrosine kinase
MSIIEQATKRLEELRRGGVEVPWEASRLPEEQFNEMARASQRAAGAGANVATPPPAAIAPGPSLIAKAVAHSTSKVSPRRPGKRSNTVELDLARLERAGLLVPSLVRSDLALEFRHVKRPLLKNAQESSDAPSARRSLIMVTSALPGEGKTFCALNLALSIAMEVDTSVLLVDADVVRPAIFDRLGLNPGKGLLDLLTDDALDMSEVMLRTNIPKLSLLPAGHANDRATELLASDAMERWLAEIATRYPDRVVIFDAPPLLLTTEARVLASRVGQVLMVVDSVGTSASKVTEAFATIENCPLVMSVLNKSPRQEGANAYKYGYGY